MRNSQASIKLNSHAVRRVGREARGSLSGAIGARQVNVWSTDFSRVLAERKIRLKVVL